MWEWLKYLNEITCVPQAFTHFRMLVPILKNLGAAFATEACSDICRCADWKPWDRSRSDGLRPWQENRHAGFKASRRKLTWWLNKPEPTSDTQTTKLDHFHPELKHTANPWKRAGKMGTDFPHALWQQDVKNVSTQLRYPLARYPQNQTSAEHSHYGDVLFDFAPGARAHLFIEMNISTVQINGNI